MSIGLRLLRFGEKIRADAGNFSIVRRLAANGRYWHFKKFVAYVDRKQVPEITPEQLSKLIKSGMSPKSWTPLHLAAQSGSVGTVRLLLARGADRMAATADRRELPIHVAARWNRVEVIEALLSENSKEQLAARTYATGPNPKHAASASAAYSPLMSAAMKDKPEAVAALLWHLLEGGMAFGTAQMEALARVVRSIRSRRDIPLENIKSHAEIDNRTFTCGNQTVKSRQDP